MSNFKSDKKFTDCQEAINWGLTYVTKQENSVFQSVVEKNDFIKNWAL